MSKKRDMSGKSELYCTGYAAARAVGHIVMRSNPTREEFFKRIRDGGHEITDHDEGWADGLQDMAEDEDLTRIVKASRLFEVKIIVATHEDAELRHVHEWITALCMPVKLSDDNPLSEMPAMSLTPPEITETDKYASYIVNVERGMCRVEVVQRDTPYNGPSLREIMQSAVEKAAQLELEAQGRAAPEVKH